MTAFRRGTSKYKKVKFEYDWARDIRFEIVVDLQLVYTGINIRSNICFLNWKILYNTNKVSVYAIWIRRTYPIINQNE